MQPGHILKKLNLDLLTPTLGSGGGGGQGSASKIFATILLHFKISFKLKYFDPILVSGGGGGGLQSKYLLPCDCILDSH